MAYIDEKENQDINAYAGMPARQKPVLGPPAAIPPRPSQFTPAVAAPTAQGPAAGSQSNGPISELHAISRNTPGPLLAEQGRRLLTAAAVPSRRLSIWRATRRTGSPASIPTRPKAARANTLMWPAMPSEANSTHRSIHSCKGSSPA